MTADGLASRMAAAAAAVEAELDALLPSPAGLETPLVAAMRHAVLGGGKRFRAFLVGATGELYGAEPAALVRVGAAVELLHAYSLVHDDLPAMDDALLRRGKPTVHRAFDEATAILAGDALQALAFEALARRDWPADDAQRIGILHALAVAAGVRGMCAGQAIDLLAERVSLDLAQTTRLQRLKTGALIRFCVEAGCVLGGAGSEQQERLLAWADALGLAFQIRDDLLDATAEAAQLGKDARRDAEAGKATFVSLLGEAGARRELARLRARADAELEAVPRDTALLRAIFEWATMRSA